MIQLKGSVNYFLYGLLVLMLFHFIACKEASDKNVPKDKNESIGKGKIPGGNYNYLYCTVKEFNTLKTFPGKPLQKGGGKGSLMLKYCITDSGLTLHGWTFKYHKDTIFTPAPNLRLLMGKDTSVSYKVGSYLGDFIVSNADIIKVQDSISKNPSYSHVVFIPKYSADSNMQIAYDIYLASSPPLYPNPDFPNVSRMKNTDAEGRPIPPGGGQSLDD